MHGSPVNNNRPSRGSLLALRIAAGLQRCSRIACRLRGGILLSPNMWGYSNVIWSPPDLLTVQCKDLYSQVFSFALPTQASIANFGLSGKVLLWPLSLYPHDLIPSRASALSVPLSSTFAIKAQCHFLQ